MTNRITQIRCVNKKCKNLNSLEDNFCHQCETPLVKRYLKIVGKLSQEYQIGDLIGDRFLVCYADIVLDTKPHLPPYSPASLPPEVIPYLKLFSHRLHLPQVYGFIKNETAAWLLEYDNIPLDNRGKLIYPQLFPLLEKSISQVSALRQINWLWQMIQLWKPLAKQKVLSSFFDTNNLRVNGAILKIIDLKLDQESTPTLKKLADLWLTWLEDFDPLIKDIINKIILSIHQDLIIDTDKLLAILDQVIYLLGNNYYRRKFTLITATDAGKKRENNEDSCYPSVDKLKETRSGIDTLVMVCDGLGGQKSGEVASNLAIDIIQKELNNSYQKTLRETLNNKNWIPLIDAVKIHNAISKANDQINHINNQEKRLDRFRMGTTVVTGMAIAHEIYISNVGDSRIYWITKNGCHQITVDDDLATKEVRMGCGLYRIVSANPRTGALLQALGMDTSKKLKVHIRRFIIDEDSVFLLCSDGLSDYERVEQYWQWEILPILTEGVSVETACKKMIQIGLEKNGHDNITIGLLKCQIEAKEPDKKEGELSWQYLTEIMPELPQPKLDNSLAKNLSTSSPLSPKNMIFIVLIIISIALGVGIIFQNKSSQNKSSQEFEGICFQGNV